MSGSGQKENKVHDFNTAKEQLIGSAIITTICFIIEYNEEICDYLASEWKNYFTSSTDTK